MIEVSKKEGKLIWLEADNVGYNTELRVGAGCQALVLMDGDMEKYNAGEVEILNRKTFFHNSGIKKWVIYGINNKEIFTILWGFRFQDYADSSLNGATIGIRARGECKVTIGDAKKLFNTILAGQTALNEEGICDKIQSEIISLCRTAFLEVVMQNPSHAEIKSNINMGEAIKSRLLETLYKYGINIESCAIADIQFDERFDEFISLANIKVSEEIISEIVENQTKQGSMVADMVNKLNNK